MHVGHKVLTGLDLDVPRGQSLVVIAELGSGKSVLLMCILGLLTPDAGVIEIDGRDVLQMRSTDREEINWDIGMLFRPEHCLTACLSTTAKLSGGPCWLVPDPQCGDE